MLDLDETLVTSSLNPFPKIDAELIIPVKDGNNTKVFILLRCM